MSRKKMKLEQLVQQLVRQIKRKKPDLENIDVSYKKSTRGAYLSKIRAKAKGQTIYITEEDFSPEKSIRILFNRLFLILNKKRNKRFTRPALDFEGAA